MYGVIGYGTVGKAVVNCLRANKQNCWAYDPAFSLNETRTWLAGSKCHVVDRLSETDNRAEAVFICVPTPHEVNNGYNLSAIEEAFTWLKELSYRGIVIIKSTIGPFDYEYLKDRAKEIGVDAKVFVAPEFMTEANAQHDLFYSTSILYGPWTNKTLDNKVRKALAALKHRNSTLKFVRQIPTICSLVKTWRNIALAQKITLANLIFMEARSDSISSKQSQDVVDMVFDDPRLRTLVPYNKVGNSDNKLGFGGKCLPKDVEAKEFWMSKDFLKELTNINKTLNKLNSKDVRQTISYTAIDVKRAA